MIARGILAARVVGGHDSEVGELGRDLAHLRPLAAVAVAAARRRHRSTRPSELARGAQHILERVRRVRVVDETVNGWPSSTVSKRPGTPRNGSSPRAIAASATPSSRDDGERRRARSRR